MVVSPSLAFEAQQILNISACFGTLRNGVYFKVVLTTMPVLSNMKSSILADTCIT